MSITRDRCFPRPPLYFALAMTRRQVAFYQTGARAVADFRDEVMPFGLATYRRLLDV